MPNVRLSDCPDADVVEIDRFLALATRGGGADWPFSANERVANTVARRVQYHGIAGLLLEQRRLEAWPQVLRAVIHDHALARSMWELRHKAVVADLTRSLDHAGLASLLLKGTAVAYDLYPNPAARERSDTDLLIASSDRAAARRVLAAAGFESAGGGDGVPGDLRAQESWIKRAADGTDHAIDVHWTVMNYPALDRVMTVSDFLDGARPLPRLGEGAKVPATAMLLVHALMHRQAHVRAPYFVDGLAHVGGDRLIWLNDIALLSRSMSDEDWRVFCAYSTSRNLARPCLDGLSLTRTLLGATVPPWVEAALATSAETSTSYFAQGSIKRALGDLRAIPGSYGKVRYFVSRLVPGEDFMRRKYPGMAERSLPSLYWRRLRDFVERK